MDSQRRKRKLAYSDIDLERWKDYDDIITDSLWLLKSRQSTGGHKLDYHGNFIPQIANQMMRRYTKEGEVVVDWFLGSGTSAIEAANLNRRLVGVEIKPDLIAYVAGKLADDSLRNTRLVSADSTTGQARDAVQRALGEFGVAQAHLAILHPPYHDIIKFSDMPGDLSNAASVEEFVAGFSLVARNAYSTLAWGRFAALVIGDKYAGSELVPLGFLCMRAMNEAGFGTKSIIVKNIEGNEVAKGKNNNLWRYRALVGGFYIFKHEYVMVFVK